MNCCEEKKDLVEVCVWDWQTRVLHWLNAGLVITLMLLALSFMGLEELLGAGDSVVEPIEKLHAAVGYVFAVTLLLRIIWGFIGNKYARWSDIIPYTAARWRSIGGTFKWIAGGFKGTPPVELGHNPLACLFYVPLFVVLVLQAGTGIFLSGEELGMFPGTVFVSAESGTDAAKGGEAVKGQAAGEEDDDEDAAAANGEEEGEGEEIAEEIHEFGLWFILFFLAAHLSGLIIHELGERRGLLSSMISGCKIYRKDEV